MSFREDSRRELERLDRLIEAASVEVRRLGGERAALQGERRRLVRLRDAVAKVTDLLGPPELPPPRAQGVARGGDVGGVSGAQVGAERPQRSSVRALVLRVVEELGECTGVEVAARTEMTKSQAAYHLQRLVRAGQVAAVGSTSSRRYQSRARASEAADAIDEAGYDGPPAGPDSGLPASHPAVLERDRAADRQPEPDPDPDPDPDPVVDPGLVDEDMLLDALHRQGNLKLGQLLALSGVPIRLAEPALERLQSQGRVVMTPPPSRTYRLAGPETATAPPAEPSERPAPEPERSARMSDLTPTPPMSPRTRKQVRAAEAAGADVVFDNPNRPEGARLRARILDLLATNPLSAAELSRALFIPISEIGSEIGRLQREHAGGRTGPMIILDPTGHPRRYHLKERNA